MSGSRTFTPQLLRALGQIKTSPESAEAQAQQLGQSFARLVARSVPKGLVNEVFSWVWTECVEKERTTLPGDILDLLAMEYDTRTDALLFEDWRFIGELVTAWDQDLEIDLLSYIMTLVMDKGAFE